MSARAPGREGRVASRRGLGCTGISALHAGRDAAGSTATIHRAREPGATLPEPADDRARTGEVAPHGVAAGTRDARAGTRTATR